MVTSQGSSISTRGNFGHADLPAWSNRINFVVLELILNELQKEQDRFPTDQILANVRLWTEARWAAGQSASWHTAIGFFDDNTFACLSIGGKWPAIVQRVATAACQGPRD